MNGITAWLRRGMAVLCALAAGAGCARTSTSWQAESQRVAAQRLQLAATPSATPTCSVCVGVPDHSGTPAEGRRRGTQPPARLPPPAVQRIEQWDSDPSIELSSARLVADPPASQPADAEIAATQEVAIERGPLPTFGATVKRDVIEMPELLWHDTKKVYTNPVNIGLLLGAGGASLAFRCSGSVDSRIVDFYHPHEGHYRHTFSEPFRNFLDAAGNPGTAFALAGTWYLAGQVCQDIKTYEVGKRMASALIINDLSTLFLKVCAADSKSPNGEFYAWPSGHMSSTVCLATVLHNAYGPLVGVPMYAFSVFEGIERLDDREHKFSDVIFGAVLGWVIGETVMKEHRPEIFGGEVSPWIDPFTNTAGVAWTKPLGQ